MSTPIPRRWPLCRLEEKAGRSWVDLYALRRGCDAASARRHVFRIHSDFGGLLTTQEADEMCLAAGLHPVLVFGLDEWGSGFDFEADLWDSLEDE